MRRFFDWVESWLGDPATLLCEIGWHHWEVYPPGGRVGDPAYRCERCGKTKGRVLL